MRRAGICSDAASGRPVRVRFHRGVEQLQHTPGGAQVGQAAVRSESEPEAVTLTPGASAQSLVKATVTQNYSTEACQPAPVSGIDVYSPNTTEVVYLAYPTTGCSTTDPSITQLAVQPVRAE
ncbi:DUF4232 domain-containing protein [Rhodococcus fascians]|nr:DUF4232 domain-containing protein [Rhodococcus fascians]